MRLAIEFLDDEQRYNQKLNYTEILMNQIDKVRLSGSVEFRGGYWESRNKLLQGSVVKERVYISDTRQVYIGAIDQLYDLLLPFFDGKFREKNKKIKEDIESLKGKSKENKEGIEKGKLGLLYYPKLLKLKKRTYQELILLIARLGMFGFKRSKEVY